MHHVGRADRVYLPVCGVASAGPHGGLVVHGGGQYGPFFGHADPLSGQELEAGAVYGAELIG